MKVTLKDLKPNRTRDMDVDPIDPDRVAALTKSIQDEGFWGGVVCAPDGNGGYEILAGHHRTEAAIKAGIIEAEVFVVDEADDARRQHIYALENSTQRGNEGTAQAGSVASAVFVLAKALARGTSGPADQMSQRAWESAVGNFQNGKGIGRDLVVKQLAGIDISTRAIRGQLANLKASKDYDRIVKRALVEVRAEEPDLPEDVEERITKVEKKAKEDPDPKFDFRGVSRHLKNPTHVETFRQHISKKGIKDILPVDKQAELAETIVEAAAKQKDREISSEFIHEQVTGLASAAKRRARSEDTKRTAEEARIASVEARLIRASGELRTRVGQVERASMKINDILDEWPEDRPYPFDVAALRHAMKAAADSLNSAMSGRR